MNMNRSPVYRTALNRALALGGVIIIMLQAALITGSRVEVGIILIGILVNQLGVWGLAARLLPDRRVYLQLRTEANHFLQLIRQLHLHALADEGVKIETVRGAMHESVDLMAAIAATAEEAA